MYIHLNVCKQIIDVKLLLLTSNSFHCVQKFGSGSFKNVFNKMCLQIEYI